MTPGNGVFYRNQAHVGRPPGSRRAKFILRCVGKGCLCGCFFEGNHCTFGVKSLRTTSRNLGPCAGGCGGFGVGGGLGGASGSSPSLLPLPLCTQQPCAFRGGGHGPSLSACPHLQASSGAMEHWKVLCAPWTEKCQAAWMLPVYC